MSTKPLRTIVDISVKTAAAICDETIERRPAPIEQRVSIAIMQARALECRTFAGLLLINGHRLLDRFPPGPMREAAAQVMSILSVQQRERSKKIEDLGKVLAEKWPVTGDDFPDEVEESRVEVIH